MGEVKSIFNHYYYITGDNEPIEIEPAEEIPSVSDEYCVVVDNEECYSGYKTYIMRYCNDRISDWVLGECPLNDRLYKVISKNEHLLRSEMLYIIEDMDTHQIYVIGEDGIKPVAYTSPLRLEINDDCINIVNELNHVYCCLNNEGCYCGGLKVGVDLNEEGEIRMNEVLELYKERKRKEIEKKFKAIIDEEYNNLPEVKRYKELINEFDASLAELADECKKAGSNAIVETAYCNDYKYELNVCLEEEIHEKHSVDINKELEALDKFVEEVNAVLSISNSEEYQLKVLKEYGILKKDGTFNG